VGPCSLFLNDPKTPEHSTAEGLGQALFNNESFEQWSDLYKINTFSVFFMSTAFLGLLEKGTKERQKTHPLFTASITNITSMSGIMSQAQDHVRISLLTGDIDGRNILSLLTILAKLRQLT
jgi:NAD(P)-dependent dehydrogenase (short-subunit alcohol dehydrogenase family)